jgi:cytochrome b
MGKERSGRRLIWDLPVRVAHVGLIAGFAGAWITHYAGTEYFVVHAWCGYATLVIAVFRVIWGFVGTRHARFADPARRSRGTILRAAG